MSLHPFVDALSLTGRDGHYQLDPDQALEGQPGKVFGGVLLGVVLRAAGLVATAMRPVSSACQFLRPADIGEPLDIDVVSLKRGRTSELLTVSLTQGGKAVVEAHVRAADVGVGPVCEPGQSPALGDPLSVPPFDDVMRADGMEAPGIYMHWDTRVLRLTAGEPETSGWSRLRPVVTFDDPFMEAARYALSLDGPGGTIMNVLGGWGSQRIEIPWGFSNLDSLVHFHRPHGTDWLYWANRVLTGSDGLVGVQTELWSSDGQLLATAMTQVAFFPLVAGWSALRDASN